MIGCCSRGRETLAERRHHMNLIGVQSEVQSSRRGIVGGGKGSSFRQAISNRLRKSIPQMEYSIYPKPVSDLHRWAHWSVCRSTLLGFARLRPTKPGPDGVGDGLHLIVNVKLV